MGSLKMVLTIRFDAIRYDTGEIGWFNGTKNERWIERGRAVRCNKALSRQGVCVLCVSSVIFLGEWAREEEREREAGRCQVYSFSLVRARVCVGGERILLLIVVVIVVEMGD